MEQTFAILFVFIDDYMSINYMPITALSELHLNYFDKKQFYMEAFCKTAALVEQLIIFYS